MHHVFARYRGKIYHLFSDPDFRLAALQYQTLASRYRRAELFTDSEYPQVWARGGKFESHAFAKAYWGARGMIIDLHAGEWMRTGETDVGRSVVSGNSRVRASGRRTRAT